jgi:NTE family protein
MAVARKPSQKTKSLRTVHEDPALKASETLPELRKRHRINRYKIGFAFCGGVAYGMAQVGILRELEKAGIQADCVAGTSAGAILAAAYASGLSLEQIEQFGVHTGWNELYNFGVPKAGLVSSDALEDYVHRHIGKERFEQLRIPLAVVATDLCSGEEVVFTKGALGKAVRASCSIPGIYQPVLFEGRQLADGGLVENVPVEALKALGADVVIAVNVFGHPQVFPPATNVFQVLLRSWYFFVREQKAWRANADFVLEPDLRSYDLFDFSSAEAMMRVGEACAKAQIPKIRHMLENHFLKPEEYF